MDQFTYLRDKVLEINQQVASLVQGAQSILDTASPSFDTWRGSCDAIARQLLDHVLRIAVVGAIKSGKSTLVNALLHDDHLKRGAGVVTSIVTRIRQGERLRAKLFFKSWDEVNEEIKQALVLFPTDEWRGDRQGFDIRHARDRQDLKHALEVLDKDLRFVQDALNAHSVLLSSYIKGYDQVESYVSTESTTREFDGEQFAQHRSFVADDALAVYLKDIQLEVAGDFLARNIEVADCQGSDSPNPLHLAMIQDYLLKAHLIIYVISSRTGLRQADIRFLAIIKRMGIAGNMLFVCNCDFNEHDSLSDFKALVQRLREELTMIVEHPRIYSLSALFNLFDATESKLTTKEQERLGYWRKSEDFVEFSAQETRRLHQELDYKLTRERSALLLQNQLERIDVNAGGLRQWLRLNRDLLHRDTGEAKTVVERLHAHQIHMHQVQSMIQNTLEGAVQKISRDMKKELDRFFDFHSGSVLKKTIAFIREYHVPLERYEQHLSQGFSHTLYLVFQELKHSLDSFMAEKVNPEIMGFITEEEQRLQEKLRLIAQPYESIVRDALMQYEEALRQFGLGGAFSDWTLRTDSDLEAVKQRANLELPPAAASMHYSAQIRTKAVLRLGYYSFLRGIRKMFRKTVTAENAEEIRALKVGIRNMKEETERSLISHFKDYRENIKFQYIQRLAEAAGNRLFEMLTEQFGGYVGDVKGLAAAISERRNDKEKLDKKLASMEESVSMQQAQVEAVRIEIQSLLNFN
jgi:GTPase SAR1 family protein